MIDPISYFGFFGVIEAVQGADQITGDATDPLKLDIPLGASATGALVANDAGVAADRVPIHRVVDGAGI